MKGCNETQSHIHLHAKGKGLVPAPPPTPPSLPSVQPRDATLQQYSTREQVRMRSNMAYTAPIGSKGVGIIAGEGTYLATQPPSTSR